MKRLLMGVVFSGCLSLLAATGFVLMTPVPASAAVTCTLTCPLGDVVSCTGVSCGVQPGFGCFATTASGLHFGMLCVEDTPPFPPPTQDF